MGIHNNLQTKNMSDNQTTTEKVGTYAQNSAEGAKDTLKGAKEAVFGKAEEDKTLGDKAS